VRAARHTSNGCFTPTIIRILTKPENGAPAYYPGSDYVDWLGLSVYGQQYKDEPNPDIPSLVDWPYEEMSRLDPNKPHHDCGMGDRRISAYNGATQRYP